MTFRSLKTGIFFLVSTLVLMLGAVYFGITILVAYIVEDEIIEALLKDTAREIRIEFEETGKLPRPTLSTVQFYPADKALPVAVEMALKENPNLSEVFTETDQHYHVLPLKLDENYQGLLVAEVSSLLVVTNFSTSIMLLFLLLFIPIIGLAIYTVYRISRFIVKPVTDIGHELRQLQLDKSLPLSRSVRELDVFINTLEFTLGQLQDALHRERDFTRDVSHEIRTPLSVIKNTLTLVETRQWRDSDLPDLKSSVESLNQTIEVLLSLARSESLDVRSVNLKDLVEKELLSLSEAIEGRRIEVTIEIAGNTTIDINDRLLSVLCRNLIENAIQHAARPELTIQYQKPYFSFRNALQGDIPADLLQPGVKSSSSEGIGQGLYLISRILKRLNMTYRIKSEAGFFTFEVLLE